MSKEPRSRYGFKMYPNYVKAIDDFTKGNDEQFGHYMRILCYYGIYGEELAETEIERFFFTTIRESVDASVGDAINGQKGAEKRAANKMNFKKPTLQEITDYCKERHNNVDPEKFLDYYEAKGWKVGKANMKDWKASVRTWEKNNFDKAGPDSILHSTTDSESL